MEQFEGMVKKLAYSRSYSSGYSVDDLIQELRLKILEMKLNNNCMKFSYVKASLQNVINNLIRHNCRSLDSNQLSQVSEEELLNIPTDDNNSEKLELSILLRLIIEWSETQDEVTQLIVNSFFYPPEDLEQYWSELQLNNKRLQNREMIPLFTIAKYLQINKNKITDLQKKLSIFLCKQGYSL